MEYYECEKGQSQYEGLDLIKQSIHDARYVPAPAGPGRGNRFREALPPPRTGDEINRAYTRILEGYRADKVPEMTLLEKLEQLNGLYDVRFPLDFDATLEILFNMALVRSYTIRKEMKDEKHNIRCTVKNMPDTTGSICAGNPADATGSDYSLIGLSGSGKSATLSILVSRYPQVIMHKDPKNGHTIQIVYLVVVCVQNSNFSAIFHAIGAAIDRALRNTTPVYAREVDSKKSLGDKMVKIEELIEKFAIGMIVFDEIQEIDFGHTKNNTFSSLMTIKNNTKVAMMLVGTEDALAEFQKGEVKIARRAGAVIESSMYCRERDYVALLAKRLFKYQWFDEKVRPDDAIIDVFYKTCHGNMGFIIELYIKLTMDYLTQDPKPEVNAAYFQFIADKYFKGLQKDLDETDAYANEASAKAQNEQAKNRAGSILADGLRKEEAERLAATADRDMDAEDLLGRVEDRIQGLHSGYTHSQISEAFDKVMSRKASQGLGETEIAEKVDDEIRKQPKQRVTKPKTPPVDMANIRSSLNMAHRPKGDK